MNADRAFVDTNIFVYLFSRSPEDEAKRWQAYDALRQYECLISTQVINEFSNFCIKKLRTQTEELWAYIGQIRAYCGLAYVDEDTIRQAIDIHKRYGFSYYDSLMVASALEGECRYLLSEDMSAGQVIGGTLTIKNIFV